MSEENALRRPARAAVARFKDIVIQDGSSFALKQTLRGTFPGRFTTIEPRSVPGCWCWRCAVGAEARASGDVPETLLVVGRPASPDAKSRRKIGRFRTATRSPHWERS